MKTNANKTLQTIAYFGCVLIMLALVVTLIIGLFRINAALWIRVCFTILAGLLVLDVIYNCVCVYTGMSTYVAGFILYALSAITVALCFILYSRIAIPNGLVPTADLSMYLFEMGNLVAINILSITIFIVGNAMNKKEKISVKEKLGVK